jgi:hypothetical protein
MAAYRRSDREKRSSSDNHPLVMKRDTVRILLVLVVPGALIILSLLPSLVIRELIFEILAYAIPWLPQSCRYLDKPLLNPLGALVVAVIWAAMISIVSLIYFSVVRKR